MSFNIKNTDSFQKGVLATGGGGGFSGGDLPDGATNNNEYVVVNDSEEYSVGGTEYVALGTGSSADSNSIALGTSSTATNDSIAIGFTANAGNGSIAVGQGSSASNLNSIVLNGSSVSLISSSDNGFFVRPIRNDPGETIVLKYNTVTGEVGYQTSSIRYKENLEPIQGYKDLLNIEPYLFKYKDSEVTDTGLIAEHIDEYPSLRKLVYYKDYNETDEDGNAVAETKPEGVHYQKIGVFNLKLIKDLYEQDKVLTDRLKNIEEKLQ